MKLFILELPSDLKVSNRKIESHLMGMSFFPRRIVDDCKDTVDKNLLALGMDLVHMVGLESSTLKKK